MKITVGQGTHVAGRFSCIIMMIFMTTTILRLIMNTVLMLMNRSVDIPIVSNIHGFSPKTSSLPETYQESIKGLSILWGHFHVIHDGIKETIWKSFLLAVSLWTKTYCGNLKRTTGVSLIHPQMWWSEQCFNLSTDKVGKELVT